MWFAPVRAKSDRRFHRKDGNASPERLTNGGRQSRFILRVLGVATTCFTLVILNLQEDVGTISTTEEFEHAKSVTYTVRRTPGQSVLFADIVTKDSGDDDAPGEEYLDDIFVLENGLKTPRSREAVGDDGRVQDSEVDDGTSVPKAAAQDDTSLAASRSSDKPALNAGDPEGEDHSPETLKAALLFAPAQESVSNGSESQLVVEAVRNGSDERDSKSRKDLALSSHHATVTQTSTEREGKTLPVQGSVIGSAVDAHEGGLVGEKCKLSLTRTTFASVVDANSTRDSESVAAANSGVEMKVGGDESSGGKQEESFWSWFQQSKAAEGSNNKPICPEGPQQRLCNMVHKLMKRYNARTVFDASCRKNADWMPEVLKKMDGDIFGFRYVCGDHHGPVDEETRAKLSGVHMVAYCELQWWRENFPANIDLLLAWDTLPHVSFGRVYKFFLAAKRSNTTHVLFDNYPGILNSPSPNRQHLNVRKHPFRFPTAKVVVQNVTEDGEELSRQLLLYEVASLPLSGS